MKSNHPIRIVFVAFTLLLALCTPSLTKTGFPQSQTTASAPPKFARGILKGWMYFNVAFPGGTSREYNHIALSFLDKFEHTETPYPPDILSKVQPNTNSADVVAQFNAVRKLIRTEVLTLLEQVQ